MARIKIFIGIIFAFYLFPNLSFCQIDSTWNTKPELNILGFTDVFYVYDFNKPSTSERQPFLYNHNRHNEFNLNLGLIKFNLESPKYRANIGVQTGTYVNDNLAAEPGVLKNIWEANIGVALNKKNSIWLDAGILPSHIGFESAISMDNMTLTRSLLAENSPYFLTGAKLTSNVGEKLQLAALLVNGWQRMQRLPENSMLSYGTQVNFTASDNLLINWSTFIGTDETDNNRKMRYFNNVYAQLNLGSRISLNTGFDFGLQQTAKGSSNYDMWLTPIIISQYTINDFWKTAIRVEYYQDENGAIIPTGTTNGFKTTGLSLNLDYYPTETIACRIEGRYLNSQDKIFESKPNFTNENIIIAGSIAIKFIEKIGK